MPEAEYWSELLDDATPATATLTAETFDHAYISYSQPRRVQCTDGSFYVLKGVHCGKAIVNDQLIGRLGMAIGAPVGEVALIDVPQGLIDIEPAMQPITASIVHGSRFLSDVSDARQELQEIDPTHNKPRFSSLAVLYGWVGASDHQVLYNVQYPRLVYSVDHGHFFPGGPGWTISDLEGAGLPCPDPMVMARCNLDVFDLTDAFDALDGLADVAIANAIVSIPTSWTFDQDERLAMALYLARRRQQLLQCKRVA